MAIQLTKIGNSSNVPVKEFICDTQADVDALPASAPMGSTAFCIKEKTAWMKSSDNTSGKYENGWNQL